MWLVILQTLMGGGPVCAWCPHGEKWLAVVSVHHSALKRVLLADVF